MGSPESKHRKSPRPAFVPLSISFESVGKPRRITNVHRFRARSTLGSAHALGPVFFVDSQKDDTKGTCAPLQAGFGLATVLAQSHATTVALPPPDSFGSFTSG